MNFTFSYYGLGMLNKMLDLLQACGMNHPRRPHPASTLDSPTPLTIRTTSEVR